LIRELAAEHEAPRHGWRVRVATRLGIDQSFLSRLLNGGRAVIGADSVDKAVHHVGVSRAYFAAPGPAVSYRDYLGAEAEVREPAFPGWVDFIASPIGHEIKGHERRALASIVFEHGEPTAAFYEGVLYMLRNRVTPAEMERGVAKAVELAEKLQQNRNRK
jgi:transcriptional regulator with XRE-family HTH domain